MRPRTGPPTPVCRSTSMPLGRTPESHQEDDMKTLATTAAAALMLTALAGAATSSDAAGPPAARSQHVMRVLSQNIEAHDLGDHHPPARTGSGPSPRTRSSATRASPVRSTRRPTSCASGWPPRSRRGDHQLLRPRHGDDREQVQRPDHEWHRQVPRHRRHDPRAEHRQRPHGLHAALHPLKRRDGRGWACCRHPLARFAATQGQRDAPRRVRLTADEEGLSSGVKWVHARAPRCRSGAAF